MKKTGLSLEAFAENHSTQPVIEFKRQSATFFPVFRLIKKGFLYSTKE
jgi:hypothetical protein